MLWVLLFNIFLNDLFLFITKASLQIYADGSTLSASFTNAASLYLSPESSITTDGLISNNTIVNAKKIQTIVIAKRNL